MSEGNLPDPPASDNAAEAPADVVEAIATSTPADSAPAWPNADRVALGRFISSVFKGIEPGRGYIMLRSFEHCGKERPLGHWHPFGDCLLSAVTMAATATAARGGDEVAVFCPPPCVFGEATFRGRRHAGEDNVIACGVVALELDDRPQETLAKATSILGEPTLVLRSGGVWDGPEAPEDKLHAYWRLVEPATTPETLARLKAVRYGVLRLCGGDGTAVPLSHAMRWPGSWHTKGPPRLSTIQSESEHEIALVDAEAAIDVAAFIAGIDLTKAPIGRRNRDGGFKTKVALGKIHLDALAAAVPNPPEQGWDVWNERGLAFYDASHGSPEGLEAFHLYSAKSDLYDPDNTDLRWEHYERHPPSELSAGSLVHFAKEAGTGFQLPFDIAAHFDAEAAAAQPDELLGISGELPKAKRSPLALTSFNDAAASALTVTSKPLIEDLLSQGAMSVLYGESNTGKTFVAMDMAYHVASGLPWGDKQTNKGAVVYIAAEGGAGAQKRAKALWQKYGPCDGFHFILCPVDLRDPKADLKPLLDLLDPIEGLVFVVIDTFSRVMAGGDENSSVDMGAMVLHFDIIRAVTSAHVMVIHHTGKNVSKGARGHSLLRAATDTEIEIASGTISVTKQRDLDKHPSVGFGLETAVLGQDERGKDVTSCTVRLIASPGAEAGKPSPREAGVLVALRECAALAANSAEGVDLTTVAAAVGDTSARAKERVRKSLDALAVKNCVTKVGRGAWAPRDALASAYFKEIDPPEETPKKLG